MKNPLSFVSKYFAGPGQLPAVALPKPPNKAQAVPSYKTQVAKATSAVPKVDEGLTNKDLTTIRNGANTPAVMRQAVGSSPDLSATLNAYLRVGIPETFTVIGRDMDGVINVEATKLAQELLRRLTYLGDPSLGYNPTTDLQSLSESLGKELLTYGSMALELALDKTRQPLYFNPVSTTKLEWLEEDGGVFPRQKVGSTTINLDIPTFFYISADQDLLTAYSTGMFDTAIQAILADAQFMNDLRNSMKRVIQPRLMATIIEQKVKDSIPPSIVNDEEKLKTFYSDLIAQVERQLTSLEPEEALVSYDTIGYSMLNSSAPGGSIADTLSAVQKLIESKLAAGAKTLPAILGRDATSGSATTSTYLFLKNANIVRTKLNVLYSRALTQACRLLGQDVYVEFKYAELDLRPKGELEAYKSMEQSRILEQLSLGFITDEEASIALTGNLPRDGHIPLAGTMFKGGSTAVVANPNSQTSTMKGAKPGTPAAPKSPSGPKK